MAGPQEVHADDDKFLQDQMDSAGGSDDQEGSGPYETLQREGPQTSVGSAEHPEQCMPCTFYCFTRRGCNRGVDCRFCHSSHMSKLQQRREAWKKQQREKRKTIRERVAAEAQVRRLPKDDTADDMLHPKVGDDLSNVPKSRDTASRIDKASFAEVTQGEPTADRSRATAAAARPIKNREMQDPGNGSFPAQRPAPTAAVVQSLQQPPQQPQQPQQLQQQLQQRQQQPQQQQQHQQQLVKNKQQNADGTSNSLSAPFLYCPARVTLTIEQEVNIMPQLSVFASQFRLLVPLPQGLVLDEGTGRIRGSPTAASPEAYIVVEADLEGGRSAQASISIEVVDLTSGGFALGHISEVEPGKFMLLFHVQEEKQVAPENNIRNRDVSAPFYTNRGKLCGPNVDHPLYSQPDQQVR
mmetsp:Transcript_71668/g.155963  ORF Transcript_71668/g.155963 Transcript_71668/m.155963 type:complete len:410 (-) Transcript_71668:199-1428(-)